MKHFLYILISCSIRSIFSVVCLILCVFVKICTRPIEIFCKNKPLCCSQNAKHREVLALLHWANRRKWEVHRAIKETNIPGQPPVKAKNQITFILYQAIEAWKSLCDSSVGYCCYGFHLTSIGQSDNKSKEYKRWLYIKCWLWTDPGWSLTQMFHGRLLLDTDIW